MAPRGPTRSSKPWPWFAAGGPLGTAAAGGPWPDRRDECRSVPRFRVLAWSYDALILRIRQQGGTPPALCRGRDILSHEQMRIVWHSRRRGPGLRHARRRLVDDDAGNLRRWRAHAALRPGPNRFVLRQVIEDSNCWQALSGRARANAARFRWQSCLATFGLMFSRRSYTVRTAHAAAVGKHLQGFHPISEKHGTRNKHTRVEPGVAVSAILCAGCWKLQSEPIPEPDCVPAHSRDTGRFGEKFSIQEE